MLNWEHFSGFEQVNPDNGFPAQDIEKKLAKGFFLSAQVLPISTRYLPTALYDGDPKTISLPELRFFAPRETEIRAVARKLIKYRIALEAVGNTLLYQFMITVLDDLRNPLVMEMFLNPAVHSYVIESLNESNFVAIHTYLLGQYKSTFVGLVLPIVLIHTTQHRSTFVDSV